MSKLVESIPHYESEITTLELRDGVRLVVLCRLPLTPDALLTLAEIVRKLKEAMRHYRATEKPEPAS